MHFVLFQVCLTWDNKQTNKKDNHSGHGLRPSHLQLSPFSVESGDAGAQQKTHPPIHQLQRSIRGDQPLDESGHSSKPWFPHFSSF